MTETTWEKCELRKWLNDDFYESSFTAEEKERIARTPTINTNIPFYGTNAGRDTVDKIFLLSIEEAENYFASDEER